MTKLELDGELLIAGPIFAIAALLTLGVGGSHTFIGVDMTVALLEYDHVEIVLGNVIQILALGYVVVNRDWSVRELVDSISVVEAWIFYATLALVIAPPIFPAFADTIAHQPAAFLAFTIQSIGFAIVSYLN